MGVQFHRHFSPFTTTPTKRHVKIDGKDGVVFEQRDIEAPAEWSDTAVTVVAQKYFRTIDGERESSVHGMVRRVVDAIVVAGVGQGALNTESCDVFHEELTAILLSQRASFNSPVWFNVGVEERPRASACFINSVDDDMESILDLAKTEGMIFKHGGGSGVNLSKLRGKAEGLSRGGNASGPVSFMRGYDAFAGVIKSGGATRRAACMRVLDVGHPDVVEFVRCKADTESKARALIEAGFGDGIDGDVYESLPFQNANHSVRVTDAFMEAAEEGRPWRLVNRKDDEFEEVCASSLFGEIARAAWECGDPGIQFDTATNRWHTCPRSGRINGSNPCSEFVFVDNSACNLASINLIKFLDEDGEFDVGGFRQTVDVLITAQDILVDLAGYPTDSIERNSKRLRPLGLGYTNLGSVLMMLGLPYDSDEARDFAAVVTALMHFRALRCSAELAEKLGHFEGYEKHMREVVESHYRELNTLNNRSSSILTKEAVSDALEARKLGMTHGYRNAQVTLLAPTGTISLMMDCDTTGIEPELSLVKHKRLVGGGTIKQVNGAVRKVISRKYGDDKADEVAAHIERNGTARGADLCTEDLDVFRTALGPDALGWEAHVHMMAAVQPFLSGAISKTVNLPSDATVKDVRDVFEMAWVGGLKAVAVYRDGCKGAQPVTVNDPEIPDSSGPEIECRLQTRCQLPKTRQSLTHKFDVGGTEGYVTAGMYDDGSLGEVFLKVSKEGSTLSGLLDALAISISIGLQYGVPLDVLVQKFSHTRFEPSGWTKDQDIGYASSILDYVFRWIDKTFVKPEGRTEKASGPPCPRCGSVMVRAGTCHTCPTCGETTGCG